MKVDAPGWEGFQGVFRVGVSRVGEFGIGGRGGGGGRVCVHVCVCLGRDVPQWQLSLSAPPESRWDMSLPMR